MRTWGATSGTEAASAGAVGSARSLPSLASLPIVAVAGVVLLGLAGTAMPAFGYLPAIGAKTPSLAPWCDLLAMPGLARSIALSAGVALVSTAVSLVIVTAALAAWWGTRPHALLVRLISPLLSVPHAAAAFGLAFLIAPSGWIARLLSPWATGWDRPADLLTLNDPLGLAMIAGLVVKEVPFLFLVSLAALPQTDPARAIRVGASLGYGRMKAFLVGVVPRLVPLIRLPVLAVATYAGAAVDVGMILGPSTPAPLAVRVMQWANDPDLSLRLVAAAGAMLQAGVTLAVLATVLLALRLTGGLMTRAACSGRRRAREAAVRMTSGLLALLPASAMTFAILGLAVWSVAGPWVFPAALPSDFTSAAWTRLAPGLGPAIANTVLIGVTVTAIATILVVARLEAQTRRGAALDRRLAALLFLPLVVPEVSYLFGLDVVAISLGLRPGLVSVMLGHLVYVVPYVWLSLSGPWDHLDPRYARVSASLGACPRRTLLAVRLPLMLRPILTAAAVGCAVSIALYLPTLILGAGRIATVTTETIALAGGADRRSIGATALVQALLPFVGFALAALVPAFLHRHRRRMRGEP